MPRMVIFWTSQVLGVLVSILILTWIFKHRNGFGWSSNPKLQFSWHPTFMIIGMSYLYAHGIVIFRIFPAIRKWPLKLIHMSINLLAGLMAGFAMLAVIEERNAAGKSHFQSLHSWIGIGGIVLFALQWVMGVLLFLVPCSTNALRGKAISWHLQVGKAIFILLTMASVTGIISEAKGTLFEEKMLLNVLGVFVVTSMLYHLFILAKDSYKYSTSSSTYG